MPASAEKIKKAIYDAISASSDLQPGNYVSVTVKNTGFLMFGKKQIELNGRAASEKDKAKIEEIAKGLAENLEIVTASRSFSSKPVLRAFRSSARFASIIEIRVS